MSDPTGEVIWRPRPDDLSESNIARFMRKHALADAAALRKRSSQEPEWFYPAMMEDLGIQWQAPYHTLRDASRGLPWTEWFLGGSFNLVANALDRPLSLGDGSRTAILSEDDEGRVRRVTYAQLGERVAQFSGALAGLGATPGDAVGFYLPMTLEVAVALLACLKIGAVPVPVFAGFGEEALAARLADARARFLLTADGTRRRGKTLELLETARRAAARSGCVTHVVVLHHLREASGGTAAAGGIQELDWAAIEAAGSPAHPTAVLPSDARSLILYTSGTTGKPKGAVHTHAGVMMTVAKELAYHLDVRTGDTMFWLTDIGWMMGPWEILGVLFQRGTVVLLDGAPDYPDAGRVWSIIGRHRVTHLGMAPTAVRVLSGHGTAFVRGADLSTLRVLGSTGEPWDTVAYRWYFDNVGQGRCPVMNISGGTELMGCLLAPLPVEPLKPCTLQGPGLGMDVDVVDEGGRSVRGEVGYLVCRNAAPNMTRGFLGDPGRYVETYFSQFGPSLWSHGDWARVDEDGYWFLSGRADDTLKIAGKRVGPGEVEAAATGDSAVRESAAVGLADPVKGMRLVLVCVPRTGEPTDETVTRRVTEHVAKALGSSLRPSRIVWVGALPVTRSGKILRAIIRRTLAGEDPGPLTSVANPEALDALRAAALAPST